MDEDLIRENMRRNRQDPPAWKRELLRQIDSLARMREVQDVFRKHVQTVAQELAEKYHANKSTGPKELLGPGPGLTLPEKFFILAAFHDVLCEAERMPPIMKWHLPGLPEAAKDPKYPAFCMYAYHAGQCADLPDDKLQPDTLRRYVKEVEAELSRLTDHAGVEHKKAGSGPDKGSPATNNVATEDKRAQEYRQGMRRDAKHIDRCGEQLAEAVERADLAGVLAVLAEDLIYWATNLKRYMFRVFDCYEGKGILPPQAGFVPYWFGRPIIGAHEACDMLEFHKSIEYAKAYSGRMDKFFQARHDFADFAASYDGPTDAREFYEFQAAVDSHRHDLKYHAVSVAEYINLLRSQLKPAGTRKSAGEAFLASLTPEQRQEMLDKLRSRAHDVVATIQAGQQAALDLQDQYEQGFQRVAKNVEQAAAIMGTSVPECGDPTSTGGLVSGARPDYFARLKRWAYSEKKSWFKDHWVAFLWALLAIVIGGLIVAWLTGWLGIGRT